MTTGEPEPLSAFLARERTVSVGETGPVLEQAMALLEQVYVHLPATRGAEADPLERLESLRRQPPDNRLRFHEALLSVFARLGDRHTRCVPPEPFASRLAFLPVRLGEFLEHGERHLVVLGSATGELEPGVRVVSWNGLPVEEVLARHEAWQHGAHAEARQARALQTLTFRPLNLMPPPAEETVTLEGVSPGGKRRTARLAWSVAGFTWFARHFPARPPVREGFQARTVNTARGTFGHLQVSSLRGDPERFLAELVRTLGELPPEGLILDLRDCEEGFVQLGERLLQLFTHRKITPEPFQFRVTEWSQRLVRSCEPLAAWAGPVERAAARGEAFSEGLPLTSEAEANGLGRRYAGPVVLLTNALTYSTAEMFVAGFQDHGIGTVLGTAARTGGGGASPWPQSTLFQISRNERFRPQPQAPSFRLAVRRCLRVHGHAGELLEGVGVIPDQLHPPTRADLFHDDADLLDEAARLLRRA